LRQIQGEAGSGKNDVNAFGNSRLHQLGVVRQSYHDIDAENAAGELPGFGDLHLHRPDIRSQVVREEVRLRHADAGCGDNADAAEVRDCRGQLGQ